MGREWELKFQANSTVFAALQQRYENFHTITMETAYFDTPGRDLANRKWMLRRRLENGQPVCTLKTPLPDGSRGEWEAEAMDIQTGVARLSALGCPRELSSLAGRGLAQTCAARFTRKSAMLTLDQCTLELALDQGVFLGNGREKPFMELEVEYKSGSQEAVSQFAAALAEEFQLIPEEKSKVQRALELSK